ncbi:MAG: TMEM200 family protein [Rhodobacteraceae bacterium]|nr:TMEM200 family protein [Paracoccaceae bacterium]
MKRWIILLAVIAGMALALFWPRQAAEGDPEPPASASEPGSPISD